MTNTINRYERDSGNGTGHYWYKHDISAQPVLLSKSETGKYFEDEAAHMTPDISDNDSGNIVTNLLMHSISNTTPVSNRISPTFKITAIGRRLLLAKNKQNGSSYGAKYVLPFGLEYRLLEAINERMVFEDLGRPRDLENYEPIMQDYGLLSLLLLARPQCIYQDHPEAFKNYGTIETLLATNRPDHDAATAVQYDQAPQILLNLLTRGYIKISGYCRELAGKGWAHDDLWREYQYWNRPHDSRLMFHVGAVGLRHNQLKALSPDLPDDPAGVYTMDRLPFYSSMPQSIPNDNYDWCLIRYDDVLRSVAGTIEFAFPSRAGWQKIREHYNAAIHNSD